MHFRNLDAYFHVASHGDPEAYKILYEEFVKKAKYIIKSTLRNSLNFPIIPEDFSDYIDYLFFKAINDYDPERGSFSWYIDYVIKLRLEKRVQKAIAENQIDYDLFDLDVDSEIDVIEYLPDPNQKSFSEDIATCDFKLKIASPKEHCTRKEKIQDKIVLLQYAGYKNAEIARELNLTINELRTYLKRIQSDQRILNLKLELK